MFRFSSLMVLCAFAVSFSLAGAARADDTMGDNPAYQSWAKFKPGTMVTYSVDANTAGNTSSTQITQTLKDIDADKATIEVKMSMVMAGNKTDLPAMTHEIPAKIRKVDPATTQALDVPKTETSTEDVQAGGKTYSCKKTTITSDANGLTTKATTWSCDGVPGMMVKMESESTGAMSMSTKMMLTDFEAQ